jgi:hypothetical protein
MTLDELCDQFDCTEEEREQVYYFWLAMRLKEFLKSIGVKYERH